MITAKNYAANALCVAQKSIDIGTASSLVKDIAYLIPKAQHFAIPDGGKIFDDELKGIDGTEVHLPYETITVESVVQGKKICVVATQAGTDIAMFYCVDGNEGTGWCFVPAVGIFEKVEKEGVTMNFIPEDGIEWTHDADKVLQIFSLIVLELCEALSCSNVTHEPIEKINPSVNARRIRAGKLPLYETHHLVINAGKSTSANEGGGGTHASPRQHLRRGHIRRLPASNVWVNSCVVGSAEKGVIHKDYSVKIA